jgi:hypothetical protein
LTASWTRRIRSARTAAPEGSFIRPRSIDATVAKLGWGSGSLAIRVGSVLRDH